MASRLYKTVKPSGGDYTTLSACVNANEKDLTSSDEYFDIEIDGDWTSTGADTTNVLFDTYTTDATRYINVYTTATEGIETEDPDKWKEAAIEGMKGVEEQKEEKREKEIKGLKDQKELGL